MDKLHAADFCNRLGYDGASCWLGAVLHCIAQTRDRARHTLSFYAFDPCHMALSLSLSLSLTDTHTVFHSFSLCACIAHARTHTRIHTHAHARRHSRMHARTPAHFRQLLLLHARMSVDVCVCVCADVNESFCCHEVVQRILRQWLLIMPETIWPNKIKKGGMTHNAFRRLTLKARVPDTACFSVQHRSKPHAHY